MSDTLGHVDAASVRLEAIPLATYVVQGGRRVHCNSAAMRLLGLSSSEELGQRPLVEFVHPDERAAAAARQEAVLAGETIEAFVERTEGPGGTWRHLEMSAAPTVWQGRPAGLYVVRNVTDQPRSAEPSRSLSGRLSTIVDSIRVGAGMLDERGVIRSANQTLCDLVGVDPTGHVLEDLVDDQDRAEDAASGVVTRLATGPSRGRWVRVTVAPLSTDLRAGSLLQVEDVDDKLRTQELLRGPTHADPITELPNRAGFVRELTIATAHGGVAVVALDIDDFGLINESLGPAGGDDVLRAIAHRLTAAVRPADTVARVGGDSFAVLAPYVTDVEQALAIGDRCHATLASPLVLDRDVIHLRTSLGVTIGDQGEPAELILSMADAALGRARRAGGDRVQLASVDTVAVARERLELDAALRSALADDAVESHLQPVWRLHDGVVVGFESLARWTHEGRAIRPDVFVRLAEELHLSRQLDVQVAERAASLVAEAVRRGHVPATTYLSVNVDPEVLCETSAAGELVGRVRDAGLSPSQLVIELTERRLPADGEALRRGVAVVQGAGVRVALDDFGVGQSSLARLITLPFDVVKLDREFVRHLHNPRGSSVVQGILDLCRRLGVQDVVEGVETERQRRTLIGLGASQAQGWLVAPALDPAGVFGFDPGGGRFHDTTGRSG